MPPSVLTCVPPPPPRYLLIPLVQPHEPRQVDIIHRYNADEARNLKQYGELPEHARINETAVDLAMEGDGAEDDIGIDFDGI